MDLKSIFDQALLLPVEQQLEAIRSSIVTELDRAFKTHRHPWHQGMISTVELDRPKTRVVVLRSAESSPMRLRCHTDLRSTKIEHLRQNPAIAWTFYELSSRVQLRLEGTAKVLHEGPIVDAAWQSTGLPSRRCYLAPFAPSSTSVEPTSNLPVGMENRDPIAEESELGRANFAVIITDITRIDWLYLKHDGHRRAEFTLTGQNWSGQWLAP